ncbi:GlxA family transcriptional regulator [Marinobacterium jannaschii]|uniref:GlxA family transcriptional regulator n=1 Tax=Marinobacterium jannaschii TaxID=64970 RepID=UPI000480D878|nr:GlxA family transcriptional regulator [Marinobacterium jannaschii]
MILKPDKDGVFNVTFLLFPEYAMVALMSAIEPMRVANRFAGKTVFRWEITTEDGEPVEASNEMALRDARRVGDVGQIDNLFLCSSFNPEKHVRKETVSWLRKQARQGTVIGAMDTGCHWLVEAGLLKDRRITMHWEGVPAFQEMHPALMITNELFEIDKGLITCAGGSSAIDLMLHIIQTELGHELAMMICEQFIKSGIRQKSDKQRIDLSARLKIHHPRLLRVLAKMEENLETPLSPGQLAEFAHLSVRQLERLFRSHLQHSPSEYYMKLRLERARQLLKESSLSVSEVAIACGFGSASHFTRTYRKHFACSPREER